MERGDFISGEAWCKYKFERESKKEEIERLQRKVERANKNLHNRISHLVKRTRERNPEPELELVGMDRMPAKNQ